MDGTTKPLPLDRTWRSARANSDVFDKVKRYSVEIKRLHDIEYNNNTNSNNNIITVPNHPI